MYSPFVTGCVVRDRSLPFRELDPIRLYLGFHSLCSFHPRLYRFVAFGDMMKPADTSLTHVVQCVNLTLTKL